MDTGSANDELYMRRALRVAAAAGDRGEVPVGAVLVSSDGRIVAEAGNSQIGDNDPTAHAEVQVLRGGAKALGNYRLTGCSLYVTLEPCTMCCGAMIHARINRLVFAAAEPRAGAVVSTTDVLHNPSLNHAIDWHQGVLATESGRMLQAFFAARRAQRK